MSKDSISSVALPEETSVRNAGASNGGTHKACACFTWEKKMQSQLQSQICRIPRERRQIIFFFQFWALQRRFMTAAVRETKDKTIVYSQLTTRTIQPLASSEQGWEIVKNIAAILQTCQLLHAEAMVYFWKLPLLDLGDSPNFPIQRQLAKSYQLQWVRKLHLGGCSNFCGQLSVEEVVCIIEKLPRLVTLLVSMPNIYVDSQEPDIMAQIRIIIKEKRREVGVMLDWIEWWIQEELI